MKLLQNKLTREIGCLVRSFEKTPEKITVVECIDGKRGSKVWYYNSLAELNEEWEDYNELEYWYIDNNGDVLFSDLDGEKIWEDLREERKQIGNYFETREEAEKAVERLRAWKRLKDKGFRFDGYDVAHNSNGDLCGQLFYNAGDYCIEDVEKDLDLLFGGEE